MHFTDYYAILERDHTISNPITSAKLDLLVDTLRLADGMSVLDLGSGKGWMLARLAAGWDIRATGLEINPDFLATARVRIAEQRVEGRVQFVEGPARDFSPDPAGYDIVLCIGASFAIGTFADAVAWMRERLKPGGMMAIGEPFFTETPPADLLSAEEVAEAGFLSLAETAAVFERNGLEVRGLVPAARDDWDRYYSGHWNAAASWALENPEHPDCAELLARVRHDRAEYLRWERRYLDWGIFIASHAP